MDSIYKRTFKVITKDFCGECKKTIKYFDSIIIYDDEVDKFIANLGTENIVEYKNGWLNMKYASGFKQDGLLEDFDTCG